MAVNGEPRSRTSSPKSCRDGGDHCALPCAGCPEAVASVSRRTGGASLRREEWDGCWVVRIGQVERLRADDPCLACAYFRGRVRLQAG